MATTSDASTEYGAAAYKSTAMIASMIASSLLMYILVAEILLRSEGGAEPPAFFGQLRIILFVLAGALIFMTTVIKGLLLRRAPADPDARIARVRSASITAMALAEVPAVCGLVLVVLGGVRTDFYMLLVISCYMMVRHFPRRGPWDEYLRRPTTDVVR
jgi:hypothetical protein